MVKRSGPGPGERPRKSAKSLAGAKLYRDRLAAIRPLLDKGTVQRIPKASPTAYAKRKVRLYYQYLFGSEHGPGITQGVRARVTVKSPKKRAKLQAELGQGALPGIKYVFVPTVIDPRISAPMPVDIVHREDEPDIVEFGGIATIRGIFDQDNLLADPQREVRRIMHALLDSVGPPAERVQAALRKLLAGRARLTGELRAALEAAILAANRVPPEMHRALQAALHDHPRAPAVVRETLAGLISGFPAAITWHYLAGDRGFTYMNSTPSTERGLLDTLRGIMLKYSPAKGNHFWGRWLTGMELTYSRSAKRVRTIGDARDADRERRKRIGKIKLSWLNVLDAVERGGLPIEAISRKVAGMVGDPQIARTVQDMKKVKLISGDDNRWSITSAGRDYLENGRGARGI